MAHPNKKDAAADHSAKLHRMTRDYGSPNPSMMKNAPVDILKSEGPEDVSGFGSDSSAAKPRGDKPARKSMAANPLSTYKRGGAVKARAAGGGVLARADGGDVSSIEEANKNQADSRARGGRTKHGKGTHVNVIVAPQGGGNTPIMPPHPAMVPPVVPLRPPMGGPPGMPPGAPPAGPGGPMMPSPPGMPPPGAMAPRASGGRVGTLADQGLSASDEPTSVKQMKGGKYDAGSASGEGRLEKISTYGKKTSNAKPQTV